MKDKPFDIDDYINSLLKTINKLKQAIQDEKNIINSLKNEIETQRKEIESLREERRQTIDRDKPPGYYNGLWEIDETIL